MKKLFLFFAVLLISLTVLGQTYSPTFNEFYSKYQASVQKFLVNYEAKDFKQVESNLKESLTLVQNLKLTEEELYDFQEVITTLEADIYYNLACVYSLSNQKKQAITAFEKAVELGYSEYQHAKSDADLDNIRKEKRFIALMNRMKLSDKLHILQHSGSYRQEATDSLPEFTYQSSDNRNLQEVRRYFNLDSIAGNGDEVSQIINLLLFVSNNIKYDGSNWAFCEFDAIDLYNYHKATGKGINCRLKAIVLNEMYLAMGLKSRYVTCMPKDQNDPDCHVINSVYSEILKKWLWMDPSHGIYVTDDNNNLLSISEVRERLINDEPLLLNKETSQNKEWYLDYYMAKNLYWLECNIVSRFNAESRYRNRAEDLQYVALTPIGFDEENRHIKGDIITHDDDYFWQTPTK